MVNFFTRSRRETRPFSNSLNKPLTMDSMTLPDG
jgi:hypothetical protein